MHIKRIHEMEEKLTEIALCEINKGIECVNTAEMGAVIDMIKDLACAEKDAREAKEMEKEEEDEKKENEYFLKMLKEEYGDEEGEKRFYSGQPRSRTSGRFMRRGDGRRRGYEEPPYYHMNPEYRMDLADYKEKTAEELRDLDRSRGKLYFSEPMVGNMSGGNTSGNSGNSGNSSDGGMRSYTEGYNDGNRRGYEEGMRDGRSSQTRDRREGRSGQMRRGYMETKEANKDNSPESKQRRMKDLETYAKELTEDIVEMVGDATPEEHALMKQKLQVLLQKL